MGGQKQLACVYPRPLLRHVLNIRVNKFPASLGDQEEVWQELRSKWEENGLNTISTLFCALISWPALFGFLLCSCLLFTRISTMGEGVKKEKMKSKSS